MKKVFMKALLVMVMVVGMALPTVSFVAAGQCLPSDLSPEEEAALVFMREEEKLARDVYTFFYETYHLNIFNNIARSEQRHMDTIKVLLDRYGIADPAEGKGPGEFTNADIKAVYDQMILDGSTLEGALNAGVQIEQEDIADLQAALAQVDNRDIKTVFLNLLRASGRHLNAFVTLLTRHGFTVAP